MEQQHRMDPAAFATADMLVLDDLVTATTATTVASRVAIAQTVHRSPRLARPGSRSASPAHPNLGPFGHPAVGQRSPRSATSASPPPKWPRSTASNEAEPHGQVHGSNGTAQLQRSFDPADPSHQHPTPAVQYSATHPAHHSTPFMNIANGQRSAGGHYPPPELWGGQMNAQAGDEGGSEWWRRLDDRVAHMEAHMKAENEQLRERISDLEAIVQAMKNEVRADMENLRADAKSKISEDRFGVKAHRSGSPTQRSDSPKIVGSGSLANNADAQPSRNGIISPYKMSLSSFKVKISGVDFADEEAPIMIQNAIHRTPSNVSSAVSTGIPAGKKKKAAKGRDKNSFLKTHSITDSGSEDSEEPSRHGSNASTSPRRGNSLANRVGVPGMPPSFLPSHLSHPR